MDNGEIMSIDYSSFGKNPVTMYNVTNQMSVSGLLLEPCQVCTVTM